MDVTDPGGGRANFRFYWLGSVAMSITDIYFDDEGETGDGVLDAFFDGDISGPAGVAFSQGASPPDLPPGNPVNFRTSPGLLADSDPPASQNGVDAAFPTEFLDISIDLFGSSTFADVIAALNQGFIDEDNRGLRVGLHVQAIGATGDSEQFVNLVPLPPAAFAGFASLAGVAGLGFLRRRSLRK